MSAVFYHMSYYIVSLNSFPFVYFRCILGTWKVMYYFVLFFADEMYVLSSSNKRVSIQLLGKSELDDKLSRIEELTNASLAFMGVGSPGVSCQISTTVPSKLNSITIPFFCLYKDKWNVNKLVASVFVFGRRGLIELL